MSTGEFIDRELMNDENKDFRLLDSVGGEIFLTDTEIEIPCIDIDAELGNEGLVKEPFDAIDKIVTEEFGTDSSATDEHLGFDSGQPSEDFVIRYMEDPYREEDLAEEDTYKMDPEELIAEAEGEADFEQTTNMNEKIYGVSRLADRDINSI